jgi:DNA-directed RNA polymerase specialized sigma subunit, sigma24 homolog
MEGKHPKRRKDKYNPYNICQIDGKCYLSFQDGQGALQELEISRELYNAFNDFELADLSHLNIVDRHLEQSEVWENTLNARAFHQPKTVEETVFNNIQIQYLHKAIRNLPKKQKRRLILHYFYQLTYVEIAKREKCSVRAVEYSVHGAIINLRKFFEKN